MYVTVIHIHVKLTNTLILSPRMILLLLPTGHGGVGGRKLPQHMGQEEED
jgi:hypothetical protein